MALVNSASLFANVAQSRMDVAKTYTTYHDCIHFGMLLLWFQFRTLSPNSVGLRRRRNGGLRIPISYIRSLAFRRLLHSFQESFVGIWSAGMQPVRSYLFWHSFGDAEEVGDMFRVILLHFSTRGYAHSATVQEI